MGRWLLGGQVTAVLPLKVAAAVEDLVREPLAVGVDVEVLLSTGAAARDLAALVGGPVAVAGPLHVVGQVR